MLTELPWPLQLGWAEGLEQAGRLRAAVASTPSARPILSPFLPLVSRDGGTGHQDGAFSQDNRTL